MDGNLKVKITVSKPRGKQVWLTDTLDWWKKPRFQSQSTNFMLESSQKKAKQSKQTKHYTKTQTNKQNQKNQNQLIQDFPWPLSQSILMQEPLC